MDGDSERLFHLHAVVHEAECHLLDTTAVELGEEPIHAQLPSVGGAGHPNRPVGSRETLCGHRILN